MVKTMIGIMDRLTQRARGIGAAVLWFAVVGVDGRDSVLACKKHLCRF
jgi:hypothetical protein